jgi:hypothetical protein
MAPERSIVDRLASEAIRLGVKTLEVEYKDGHEEVFATTGPVGFGIASLRSSTPEAASLRSELRGIARRSRRVSVGDGHYELRCRIFESFGEDAFRLEIRPVKAQTGPRAVHGRVR